ncbi:tetratricopeptide repeat protein [Streptomyces sp. ventii]|uniref:Tetratricopeptide repeat protein n=1 Tax=Streptomyces spiramenti TaxID=2720606 RepID=A0ABX1AKI6_9ACTN|nr:tetratricopeptide repeat protein [Streptomyces spiramenti]
MKDRHRRDVEQLLARSVEAEVRRSQGGADSAALLQRAQGALDQLVHPAAEEWTRYRQAEHDNAPRRLGERFDAAAVGGLVTTTLAATLAALLTVALTDTASDAGLVAAVVAAAAVTGFFLQALVAHVWTAESNAGSRNQPGGVEQLRLAWLTAVEVRGIRPWLEQQRALSTRSRSGGSTAQLPAQRTAGRRANRGDAARTRAVLGRSFDQLPDRGKPFIGRRDQLADITQWVNRDRARTDTRPTVVVLHGPPGSGRTMLARWAAHELRSLFRGACLADLRGHSVDEISTRDALLHLMSRLGAPQDQLLFREGNVRGTDGEAQLGRLVERYRRHLTGLPVVIILDDATDAAQVRTLVPERSSSLVLVTTTEPLDLSDAPASVHHLAVGPLDTPAAVELLRTTLRETTTDAPLPPDEDPSWTRLAEVCAHRPLLLRMAGPGLATRTPAELAAALDTALPGAGPTPPGPPGAEPADPQDADPGDGLLGDTAGSEAERVLHARYAEQSEDVRRLLRRLALAGRASLGPRAAAALLDRPQKEAARHLGDLAEAGLIRTVRGDRFRLHDLVRRFARARLAEEETGPERAAAQERLIRSYAELADTVIRLVDGNTSTRADLLPAAAGGHGFSSVSAALRWLDDESDFITATLRHADEGVDPRAVQHLLGALADYCLLRGDLYRLGELNELAQSVDQGLLTRSVTWRTGVAERQLGELDKAHSTLSRVVNLYQEARNQAGAARALRDLGITLQHQGHLAEALAKLTQALDLQPRDTLPGDRAWTLHALAAVERERGRLSTAAELLAESLELHRSSGSVHGEAWARLHLGQTAMRRGAVAEAETELRTSQELYERSRDVRGQAWVLTQLGTVRVIAGDSAAGEDQLRSALAQHRENGDTRGEAWTLFHLGQAQEDAGNLNTAMRTLERARTMFNQMPDRYGVACARHHEARVTRDQKAERTGSLHNSGFARQLLAAARRDYERAGVLHGQGWTGLELAVIDAGNGRPDRALELADESLKVFTAGYGENRPDVRGAEWARFLRATLLPLASPGGVEAGEAAAREEVEALLREEDGPWRDTELTRAVHSYSLMLGRGQGLDDRVWSAWRLGMVPRRAASDVLGVG